MKSVLITGISGCIGQALALELLEQGWGVYGVDTKPYPNPQALSHFWELSAAEERFWIEEAIPVLQSDPSFRAFVHVAAIQVCKPIAETTARDWEETFSVNLTAAFFGAKYLAPLMRGKNGAIVHVASVHALSTSSGMAAYASSKAGLVAFTRSAALELADVGIRVNAVLPGAVDSEMLSRSLKRVVGNEFSAHAKLIANTPLKRIASPQEIARTVRFLLSEDDASFITGSSLVVDGGVSIRLATE